MSIWPDDMTVKPIVTWPGALRRDRRRSPFSASIPATMEQLRIELAALDAKDAFLQVAIPAHKFGKQGRPYADARAEHPGVILTLDSMHGPLSYPCDTFLTWQDNLRAIVLALEALRKVDRYGVTQNGEQYRGFLAIGAAHSTPSGFESAAAAREFIFGLIRDAGWTTVPGDITTQLRQAKRLTHPDMGGDAETFQRVTLAEQLLNP